MLPAMLSPTLPYLGLVRDLPAPAYHSGPGLSRSGLLDFARSPGHYFALHRDASRPPVRSTRSQDKGTLMHCLVLEPGDFPFRYAVGPEVNRNTKIWREFEDAHPSQDCIKPSELAIGQAQAAAVRGHPEVAKLLATGEPEVSAYWADPVTGVLCRCRPDWAHRVGRSGDEGLILCDLKGTGDASPAAFERDVSRMRYHWQDAYYTDGYSIAAELPVLGFVFIAVETDYPHGVTITMLDEDSRNVARDELRHLIDRYAGCEASGLWPSYPQEVTQISLARWYQPKGQA